MAATYRSLCLANDSQRVREGAGKNIIPEPEPRPLWLGFVDKFRDPLIIVLLVVFCFSTTVAIYEVSVASHTWASLLEPAGVLAALLLATGVGFIFEVKAEREFRVLNRQKDARPVKVFRWPYEAAPTGRPQLMQVRKSDVVVGDIVRLENGDEVPADGRLLRAQSLLVDESAFTGELYAAKTATPSAENDATYAPDFLLRGSTVIEGHCIYQVTAIGQDTEEGRGERLIHDEEQPQTPLDNQLKQLGTAITWAGYSIAALIVAGRLVYYFFFADNVSTQTMDVLSYVLQSIMIAITLIVCAVPEGLPMSVTISLAMSMRRMLRQNNLVRKLHACETMGAATVICTDKTGTLTRNRLQVMEDSEELYADITTIARTISINSTAELVRKPDSEAQHSVGNPTEGALLYWLSRDKGIDYADLRDAATILSQEPFTPESKHMVTVARDEESGRTVRYIKGAPEIVLDMCDEIAGEHTRQQVLNRLAELQKRGRRTLAFAMQDVSEPATPGPTIFIGFVGMADPVRDDVPDAIEQCRNAGVRVLMVTGDVGLTANEVARQTGILINDAPHHDLTGQEFAATSDDDLKHDVLPDLCVLSRARPADKARLVALLQEMGHVVAVTGDGTNDAPALKRAQVGLSMGDGTARAKEASDITIIDNSFASITTAILWGRSIYQNIRRFILYQMTINVCACLIVLIGAFTGVDSPLGVTEMLWINLIMDTFAAMALAALPPDPSLMHEAPRRPDSPLIDRSMARAILGVGLPLTIVLFGLWQLLWHDDVDSVGQLLKPDSWRLYVGRFLDFAHAKPHLTAYELSIFFTIFVFLQFWNLFNARYFHTQRALTTDIYDLFSRAVSRLRLGDHPIGSNEAKPADPLFGRPFLGIAAAILIGQVFITNVAGDMFGVAPLSTSDWLLALLITSPILLVGEALRLTRRSANK